MPIKRLSAIAAKRVRIDHARIVQKLDLAENTRDRQAGFEGAMPTLRGDVTRCYVSVSSTCSSAAIVLRFHTDGFFDHTSESTRYAVTASARAGALARPLLRLLRSSLLRSHFHSRFCRRFLVEVFFATAGFTASFAAWNAAQRFFVASAIARLPAALNLRFGDSEVVADRVGCSDGFFD